MKLLEIPTRLDGPRLLEPERFLDDRGFFLEAYSQAALHEIGITDKFVQDNHSRSRQGVVRGLHFQVGEGVAKLVTCVRGGIFDVVVDVRPSSEMFGRWESFILDDLSCRQLYVPAGFAHGFCVISPRADVVYKQTGYYDPESERSIAYNDPEIGIAWPTAFAWPTGSAPVLSDRDAAAPRISEIGELR